MSWIGEASVGPGTVLGRGSSSINLGSAGLGVGAFVLPRLALTGRVAVSSDGNGVVGILGPQVQLWLSDYVWFGGGGGLAFTGPSGRNASGPGLDLRAGASFSRSGLAPFFATELTMYWFGSDGDGGDGKATVLSFMVGLQLGPDKVRPLPGSEDLQHDIGIGVATAGGLVDVVALMLGDHARTLRDTARLYGCNDDLSACPGSARPTADSAYRYALGATGLFIAGTAALGSGIYLIKTSSQRSVMVTPTVGPTNAGAAVAGSF